MYELVQVSERCYYIDCPSKIGIIKTAESEVCLIDSGNHKETGKKIKRILDEQGWSLRTIYNTHAHGDHIGGNHYLQQQTGCKIYVPALEHYFAETPILSPSFLYGGNPVTELQSKFILAQESMVEPLTEGCLPEGVSILPLPGHTWNMVGFQVDESIIYLADCLSSETTLEKYQVSFLTDVPAYLETLQQISEMKGKLFIPSHAQATEDIAPLAHLNIDKVHEIADRILAICSESIPFEQILKKMFDSYRLTLTFEQYALVGSTIRSYLTWLKAEGKLDVVFEENMMVWKTN